MSKARLVITAVTVEHRRVAEVAADYGVRRSWVYELLARPPHNLPQGRTLPANPQEVARRPTRPALHHRRTPNPARPVPARVQPPTTPPIPAPPSHPSDPLRLDAQGHPGPWTDAETHERVRTDTVSKAGNVTLRVGSRLHHIGIGRTYAGTCVILLIQDLQIRVVHAATGERLRELILDPNRDYQPTGAPKGPTRKPPK
jgi:hypothetical protein